MTSLTTKGMLEILPQVPQSDNSPDNQSRIYIELSDQYREMDAVSNVVKRNVVAQHLKEVIDVLEQKVREHSLIHGLGNMQG